MNKEQRIVLVDVSLLAVGLIALVFFASELFITILVLALIGISFYHHYYKGESTLLILGIVLGFFFEYMGDTFYKLQYWAEGSLPGMPLWLPLFWGYGFVMIHRLGNLLVKKK